MKPKNKKSFLSRFDDVLWSSVGLFQLLQVCLIIPVLVLAVFVYIKLEEHEPVSVVGASTGEADASGEETPELPQEIEQHDLADIKTELIRQIKETASISGEKADKQLEDFVKQIKSQIEKANEGSLSAEDLNSSLAKHMKQRGRPLQGQESSLQSTQNAILSEVQKVNSRMESLHKQPLSQGGDSRILDKKFEINVEGKLREFGELIENFDSQLIEYGKEIKAGRNQLQRYADSSLSPQHSVLLLCDTADLRDIGRLDRYFGRQQLQHPLQFKKYDYEVRIARGGAIFAPDNRVEGDVDPLSLDGLVTRDGQSGKTCLLDLFEASQGKSRLVMVAEGNAVRVPPEVFREWCEREDIEVNLVLIMLPDSPAPNENVRAWARFCQKRGGQLASVYTSKDAEKIPGNTGLSSVDKLGIYRSVQRALYPVADSNPVADSSQ